MAEHSSCPNCHNSDGGTNIYQCFQCRKVYCSRCCSSGLIFNNCPQCEANGEKIGEITREDDQVEALDLPIMEGRARHEELAQQIREAEERAERAREEEREQRARAAEDMQEAIYEAASRAEAAAEEQAYAIANAWKLQAEAKAGRAKELYASGLYDQALRLAQQALGETGQEGDPGNLEANMVAAWVLQAMGRDPDAKKYISNQIALLRTAEYIANPDLFVQVVKHIPDDKNLLQAFLKALHESSARWNYFRDYSDLIAALNQLGFTDEVRRLNRTVVGNQIASLRTKSDPQCFLEVLNRVPRDDEDLLQSFSLALQEHPPQQPNVTDYCILVEALVARGRWSDGKRLMDHLIQRADSPSYYAVPTYYVALDLLFKYRLFDEAAFLVDKLMRRSNTVELQVYWLEISTRSGKPVEDRLNQFLYGIPYDKHGDLLRTLDALANQRDRFSDATVEWIRHRISEQMPRTGSIQSQLMDSSKKSSWPVYFFVLSIIFGLLALIGVAAYVSSRKGTTAISRPGSANTALGLNTANVTSLRFFEGPANAPPYNQRTYLDRFARSVTRYVYWELNLKHPKHNSRIDFAINAVWHGPDNSVLARQDNQTHLDPSWTTSYHNMNWGWGDAGHWQIGSYTVDLYIENQRVATGSFEVYRENVPGEANSNRGQPNFWERQGYGPGGPTTPGPNSDRTKPPDEDARDAYRRDEAIAAGFQRFRNSNFTLDYPTHWRQQPYQGDGTITWFAPERGVVLGRSGKTELALGAMAGSPLWLPHSPRDGRDRLLQSWRSGNPRMRAAGEIQSILVDGASAESLLLINPSGDHTDKVWLVTAATNRKAFFIAFVAPEAYFDGFRPTFQQILNSIRFN